MKPSGFQNNLHVELKENYDWVWILDQPLLYWSERYGYIEVPKGFETDFSSVPRVPIAYRMWGNRNHREGALHDYLFRADALPRLSLSECNAVFLEAMKSRDVPLWIRQPMYWGVCLGSAPFYHSKWVAEKIT